MEVKLGKIEKVCFGAGGYDDCQFGLSLVFSMKESGVSTFMGTWNPETISVTGSTKWTEEERSRLFDALVRFIAKTMVEAKVTDITQLVGIPVEVTINDTNLLHSWRVLTEVL